MKKEVIDYLNSKASTNYRHGIKKADTQQSIANEEKVNNMLSGLNKKVKV